MYTFSAAADVSRTLLTWQLQYGNISEHGEDTTFLLCTAILLVVNTKFSVPNPRSTWVFQRSSHWWEDVVLRNFACDDWMENFRMSRETFYYLCDKVRPVIEKQNTRMRRCVSTEHRVAITLWVLATPSQYRIVAHLFEVAQCMPDCKEHLHCSCAELTPVYINFPTGDTLNEVDRGFKDKWGVPRCVGSIDGSHIPVIPPAMNHTDYYNRKGWYSMLVQAVVDHNCLFRDICTVCDNKMFLYRNHSIWSYYLVRSYLKCMHEHGVVNINHK